MTYFKKWEELTIADNFLFQKVMLNKEICKQFLQKVLGIKIKDIIYVESEKSIIPGVVCRSIRLDIYVVTEDGTIIDIEMQTSEGVRGYLPKRTRYYQAVIDLNTLNKGEDYTKLQKSYIIFVCTFDPFGANRKVYTFTNRCHEENGLELGDESVKIFLWSAIDALASLMAPMRKRPKKASQRRSLIG